MKPKKTQWIEPGASKVKVGKMTKSVRVRGKVQGVMFRQTFIRALQKRNLKGGATNHPKDLHEVSFTLSGEEEFIREILEKLKEGHPINSWGATVQTLEELPDVIPIENHEVTTENVDNFNWSSGVEMYL